MKKMESAPVFGRLIRLFVELDIIEFHPERLDARIVPRLKAIWQIKPCPECGLRAINTSSESKYIWCRECGWDSTYTFGTVFHNREYSPGTLLLAFGLYADSPFSLLQISYLLDMPYKTLHTNIRELEAAFERGFPAVWSRISQTINGPTQIDETGERCSGFKGQEPPREGLDRSGSGEPGRYRWEGDPGDKLTLVAACRDKLCVIQGHPGQSHEELKPVLEETATLSGELGEVWRDEYDGYDPLNYDYRIVVHEDGFVSDDGIHINRVECLWSLVTPWLRKFRGLSKQGLEQAARTYGFVRSLNLVEAPLRAVIDCFAITSGQPTT